MTALTNTTDVVAIERTHWLNAFAIALWPSLKQATGKDVDVRVTVDPSVLGGIVTTIGDTVIDGSVRSRLAQVKSHIG